MPRKAAGARLYFREDHGVFYIRDTGLPDKSTGTGNRQDAEKSLASYIASKGTVGSTRHPDRFPVSECLDIYGREHGVTVADPVRLGCAIEALLRFFGNLTVADVKGETCRRYGLSRIRTFKDGTTQAISPGTIRRELNVLQAAINYCHKEGYVTAATAVTLPKAPENKDRWLTRDEAAKLIWTAYRSTRGKHLARFILIGLYTGTRKEAILNLGFMRNTLGGWIDCEKGVIYRRGAGEAVTKKRRKPQRLTNRLLSHCSRWQRMGGLWAVEYQGGRVGDIKTAFAALTEATGFDDVTPHTLKHTAITWAIQKGLKIEDAAEFFDTSAETIRRVYYHHSPEYQDDAMEIMNRKL
jgi:integrase